MQPSLAELQRALAARILAGEGSDLDDWICVPSEADSAARVAVYVEGYPARIREAVRETFPAVAQILGDGSFAAFADRYAKDVPADLQNLNLVGAALPAYLESDRASDDLPFLPALAELEWAVDRCFHADLLAAFEPSACSGWSSEDWGARKSGSNPGSLSFAPRGRCASCARHTGVSDPRSTWIWSIATTGCWFTDGASKSSSNQSEQPKPRPSNRCKTGSRSSKLPRSFPVLAQSLDP